MILTFPLLLLYPLAIQVKRGGGWYCLFPITVVAYLYDIVCNYTEWSFLFGLPEKNDYTISKRIKRVNQTSPTPFSMWIQNYLDFFEPDGKH